MDRECSIITGNDGVLRSQRGDVRRRGLHVSLSSLSTINQLKSIIGFRKKRKKKKIIGNTNFVVKKIGHLPHFISQRTNYKSKEIEKRLLL